MPIETVIIDAAIIDAFALFAATPAGAKLQTRQPSK
jgi:hypothetical protein